MVTYKEQFEKDFSQETNGWKLDTNNYKFIKKSQYSNFPGDFEYNIDILNKESNTNESNLVGGFTSLLRKELYVENYNEFKTYLENTLYNLDKLTNNMGMFLDTLYNVHSSYRSHLIYSRTNEGFTVIGRKVFDYLNVIQDYKVIGYNKDKLLFLTISHSDKQASVMFNEKIDYIEDSINIHNHIDNTDTIIRSKEELEQYFKTNTDENTQYTTSTEAENYIYQYIKEKGLEKEAKDFDEEMLEFLGINA